jgi:hypothetical protein
LPLFALQGTGVNASTMPSTVAMDDFVESKKVHQLMRRVQTR